MTFQQIKVGLLCAMLGTVLATSGYMLSTASYVGSNTEITLTPSGTSAGTIWTAENDQIAVEVRYITSVINTPKITIHKKQQWLPLAISMISGMLLGYLTFRMIMRKSRNLTALTETETIPEPTIISQP